MVWIILSVLFGLLFLIGLIVFKSAPKHVAKTDSFGRTIEGEFTESAASGGGLLAMIAGLTAFVILTLVCSTHLVAQRQIGIVHNFSGTITGTVSNGVAFTAPWQNITKENIGLQREDFALNVDNSAVSSDQQAIYADLTLNYHLDPNTVLNLYKTVGPHWKQILIDSRVLQDFKEVTSQFTAEQITTKREELRQLTRQRLSVELEKHDIVVDDFFVKNLGYTQAYRDAITAKTIAVQQALQAKAKVAQSEYEADQRVKQAEGEAKAIALKGKALQDHPEVLQLEAIDKLNPNAQVIICTGSGSGNCPSFLPASVTNNSGR